MVGTVNVLTTISPYKTVAKITNLQVIELYSKLYNFPLVKENLWASMTAFFCPFKRKD